MKANCPVCKRSVELAGGGSRLVSHGPGNPGFFCSGSGQQVVVSRRKPCNDWCGYIASLRNKLTGDWNVIVNAKEHGIDDADGKYAVVCNAHGTIINVASLPKARPFMKDPQFCEACEALAGRKEVVPA
jgi:hypothetical protein